MKAPLGTKGPNGEYLFFLPDLSGNGRTGVSLPEEEFVKAMMDRMGNLPRCADPRCNKEFEPDRKDQTYCGWECSNRHRARKRYRTENGLPEDTPIEREASEKEKTIRAAIQITKAEIDKRPGPIIERASNGSLLMGKSASNQRQQREAKEREYAKYPIMKMYDALNAHPSDFKTSDFWPDQLNEMFELWKQNGEQLPDGATLIRLSDTVKRYHRLHDESERKKALEEAQRRGAQLYPDMDRVRNDGSVAPETTT